MKKNLFLVLIFMLSAMSMMGQNEAFIKNNALESWKRYQKFNQEQVKNLTVTKQTLDSIITTYNPLFFNIIKKKYYAYNKFGKVIKCDYWKMQNDSIEKTREDTFTYNSEKLLIEKIVKDSIIDKSLENSEKYNYTYNGKLLAQRQQYIWQDNDWVNDKKTDYETNEQGYLTKKTTYIWQNNAWENSKETIYHIDNQGLLDSIVVREWKGMHWVNNFKSVLIYNDNHVVSSIIRMIWKDDNWTKKSNWIYEYNYEDGQIIKWTQLSWKEEDWVNEYFTEFLYENGVRVGRNYYKWVNEAWMQKRKSTLKLDANTPNSHLVYPYEYMKNGNNYNSYEQYKYKIEKLEFYQLAKGDELLTQSISFYWNDKDIDNDGIAENQLSKSMIYPNPATDVIRVKIEDKEFEGTLEILNTAGQVVLKQNVNGKSAISVRGLEKGMYLYHLYNGKTVYNGKFVKE